MLELLTEIGYIRIENIEQGSDFVVEIRETFEKSEYLQRLYKMLDSIVYIVFSLCS